MIFVCYPKWTTCRKAKKFLEENDISFEERHIKENIPTIEELKEWHKKSGLPLKKFFNTSGQLYKELKLKDKIPNMSEEEQYSLLASDGMLVKRPILIGDDFVLVGFKEEDWKAALGIDRKDYWWLKENKVSIEKDDFKLKRTALRRQSFDFLWFVSQIIGIRKSIIKLENGYNDNNV